MLCGAPIRGFSAQQFCRIKHALRDVRALGVVDRSVNFRWNCGPMFQETLAVLYRLGRQLPAQSFIGGLAGADLTVATFHRVIAETRALLERPATDEPVWLNAKD